MTRKDDDVAIAMLVRKDRRLFNEVSDEGDMSVVVVDLLVAGTNRRPQPVEMISAGLLLLSWESSLRYACYEDEVLSRKLTCYIRTKRNL